MNKRSALLLIASLALALLSVLSKTARADDKSPSLESQVKSLEQEIASKAAALEGKVSLKLQNKIAEGTVTSVSGSQIVLSPINGYSDNPSHNQTVLVNSFTTYDFTSKRLSETINRDDFVIALGDVDDAGNLAAKKIIKASQPTTVLPDSTMGKVVSITGSTLTVKERGNQTVLIASTDGTALYSGDQEITFAQIKTGNLVIATGQMVKDNIFNARFVYLVPEEMFLSKPVASLSAFTSPSLKPRSK